MGKTLGLPLVRRVVTRREADFLRVPRDSEIKFFPTDGSELDHIVIYNGHDRSFMEGKDFIDFFTLTDIKFASLMGLWFKTELEAKKALGVI